MRSQHISPLQLRWTVLRLDRKGRSTKYLKLKGCLLGIGDVNNRHGATAIVPGNRFAEIVREVRRLGAAGVAFQITDLQWGRNAGATDKQWQNRVDLTLDDERFEKALAKSK